MQRSEGRTTTESKLLTANEYNNALSSGFTSMNHRFVVKTEKYCEEVVELRKRIVDFNKKNDDKDGLDDSDIEFLHEEIDESDSDIEFEAILPGPSVYVIKTEADDNSEVNSNTELQDNNTIGNITSTSLDDASSIIPNDVFSGQLLFKTTETNDRYYEDFDAAVRAPIIQCLTGWNSTHPFNTNFYDKRFVGVLLKELFDDNYSDKELDDKRILFIKTLFEIRVKNDEIRCMEFDSIVKEKQERAKNKKQNQNNHLSRK